MSRTRACARRAAGVGMRALVALVVGTIVLTGCQSNPKPPPLDSAPESPSPSESPTAAAPTLPPEAQGTSEAAAKAFVRHYVASVNYAMSTGDTQELALLAKPSCSTCQAMVHRVEEVYGDGGRLEGSGWRVLEASYLASDGKQTAFVSAAIQISPQIAYRTKSSPPSRSKPSRGNLDFALARTSAGWQVARLEATQ